MEEKNLCTTSGKPIDENTRKIDPATGMQQDYIVLCPVERAKGFIRPYRDRYRHVGERPKYPLRDLTEKEKVDYDKYGYVKFETYPESESSVTGRFWTGAQLKSGCGTVTTMGKALSETWRVNPQFYGATFCCGCSTHFPVAQFVWEEDGTVLGS